MSKRGASTALNFQSATLADFGGISTGATRTDDGYYSASGVFVNDGIERTSMLVKAAGTGISKNLSVYKDTGTTDITVLVTPSASGNASFVFGVNNTGEPITNGNYFWLNLGPDVFWLADAAGTTAGTNVMPSNATAGNCEALTGTTWLTTVPSGMAVGTGTSTPVHVVGRFPVAP